VNNTINIPEKLKPVLEDLTKELKNLFSTKLKRIILYGSYARGDYEKYSDVDLMILCDGPVNKVTKEIISDISTRYLLENGFLLSILVNDEQYFDYWKDVMDLFVNVEKEGVVVL